MGEPEHQRAEEIGRADLAEAVRATPKLDRNRPRIERLREIVRTRQAARMEGQLVDGFTASAIVQVYDACNEANKKKLDSMTLPQAASVSFKAIERVRRPK